MYWPTGAAVEAAESARDRFLKEAPKQWLEYRRTIARHTEATSKNSIYKCLGERKLTAQSECTFILGLDRQCVRVLFEDSAEACNPKYRFNLKAGRDKQWAIERLRMDASWRVPDDLIGRNALRPMVMGEDTTFGSTIEGACVGQMLWAAWFPLMVLSSDFRLIRATDLGDDGQLVKVEFEFEPTKPTGGAACARSGMVVLDTKRYWLIHEAEVGAAETQRSVSYRRGTLKVTNEFKEFMDGKVSVPFVSRQVLHVSFPKTTLAKNRQIENEYVSDVDMHVATNLDEKQFTLSAFGLPEPDKLQIPLHQSQQSEEKETSWMLWLGLGIIAMGLAVLAGRCIAKHRCQGKS